MNKDSMKPLEFETDAIRINIGGMEIGITIPMSILNQPTYFKHKIMQEMKYQVLNALYTHYSDYSFIKKRLIELETKLVEYRMKLDPIAMQLFDSIFVGERL